MNLHWAMRVKPLTDGFLKWENVVKNIKHAAAVVTLVVAGLDTSVEANAKDFYITEAWNPGSVVSPLIRKQNPPTDKKCAKARVKPYFAGKYTAICDRNEPGSYYSTQTCRCEKFI